VKSSISATKLAFIEEKVSPLIFGTSMACAERAVRQYLMVRKVGSVLQHEILFAVGSKSAIVIALPPIWCEVLIANGLNVDMVRSINAWRWSIFLDFVRNIIRMGCYLLAVFASQGKQLPQDRYVYMNGLSANNLPLPNSKNDASSYDICSWYAQWNGRLPGIESIRHGVQATATSVGEYRVEEVAPPFLLIRGTKNILTLCIWCCRAIFLAAFDFLRGRWWHAILLSESMLAKMVQLSPNHALAKDYLFHFSSSIYRPLWTYEAEKKGSRVCCYFYSTSEQPKSIYGYESQKFEMSTNSWPLYLVWDEYQKQQILRDITFSSKIVVVGPIPFSDSDSQFKLPAQSIAVFDGENWRLSKHFPSSTIGDYFAAHPDLSEHFLRNVQEILNEYGLTMAYKRKRDIGSMARKKGYKKILEEISSAINVIMISPDVSPIRLIEKCHAVISMPFTSAALYCKEKGIPSVYYDPTGWIQRDDRAAHGIPILIGKCELRKWVSEIVTKEIRVELIR